MSASEILLVDDNVDLLQSTATLLSHLGYPVKTAENGQSALTALRQWQDIRVLVTDIIMPGGMNGFELAVRAKRLRPDLCVLYVTGHAPQETLEPDQVDGRVLLKPWTIAQLEDEIKRCLKALTK